MLHKACSPLLDIHFDKFLLNLPELFPSLVSWFGEPAYKSFDTKGVRVEPGAAQPHTRLVTAAVTSQFRLQRRDSSLDQ